MQCIVCLSLVSIKCFSGRNKSELFARANAVAFCQFLVRNNGFLKVAVVFFVLALLFSFRRTEYLFFSCTGLAKVWHVRLCCELAGFCCEGCDCLWALVSIHREELCTVVRPANTCMETRLYWLHFCDCSLSTLYFLFVTCCNRWCNSWNFQTW